MGLDFPATRGIEILVEIVADVEVHTVAFHGVTSA
jgi:hypothetical protein